MSTSEPPSKIQKIMSKAEEEIEKLIKHMKISSNNLTPVISDEIYAEIPLVTVYVATIKQAKDISQTILLLNEKLPLKKLEHLKRVSRKEIILFSPEVLKGESIEQFTEDNFPDLKNTFEGFKEVAVPSLPPKVKRQFEVCNKIWPCNFHPNKYNEKLVSGSFFSLPELEMHKKYMEIVCETVRYYLKLNNESDSHILPNAAVVIDPSIASIVAISFENKTEHPVQHAAMLAIDNVAKTQNGGAWVANREKLETIDAIHRGIDQQLCCLLKKLFPEAKFGAKQFRSKRDVDGNVSDEIGPYLCTNYDVYLLRETCVMCSMALVHARAKRVFFVFENSELGGLKSKSKLQTIASLNHHFEVFTGYM